MRLAENTAPDSGPDQHHVQISELGVGWEPQVRLLQAGSFGREEGPGAPAVDPLSVPLTSSHQPVGPSCPGARRRGQGISSMAGGFALLGTPAVC